MGRKTALVTGASHGIGRAIALGLAAKGYALGINYFRSEKNALEVCEQIKNSGGSAIPLKADVSNLAALREMFKQFFKEFSTIDLMVNNAGVSEFYPFLEVTEEQWEKITFTDWKSTFFGTQIAAQNMVENKKQGLIINISSNHADGC